MRVHLRPSIAADAAFFPASLPHRIKAITALAAGRVIGIGGLGFRPDGTVIAFVQMADEARRYPAAIHRAGLMAMRMIRESGATKVLAEAQPNNPAAERWLLRLGFSRLSGSVFVWTRTEEKAADVE